MPEGVPAPEHQPSLQKQPINGNTVPEVSKRRGIRDLIPQRLKELFSRRKKSVGEASSAEPTPSVEGQFAHPVPESVSSTAPMGGEQPMASVETSGQALPSPEPPAATPTNRAAVSSTEMTLTSQARTLTTEQNVGIIHPDIEEGARQVIEERLVNAVRIGSVVGMEVGIKDLASAWEQAQKAANSTFELTPEGRQAIPERVKEICEQNLQEGLASIYRVTEYEVRTGQERGVRYEPERIEALFKVADEFEIPLTYMPQQGEAEPRENTPAVVITSKEQALVHMQEIIDRNLPKGMHGIISLLGYQVGSGLLKQLPDYEQRIERWVDIMQQRGWTVVDEPLTPVMGEAQAGVLVRQVNRGEIRQLIDQAVRDNLAKGVRRISEMVGYKVKSGFSDPLSIWGTPENIALYTEAGRRYGLAHQGAVTAEGGGVNPDMYFDPAQLPEHIRQAVRENIPEGLQAIEDRHLRNVRAGIADQVAYGERTAEEYIRMANEYGIQINPDQIRQKLTSHMTEDNLREGVRSRLAAVRDALRQAKYNLVSLESERAEEFRQFVHQKGFDGKVDLSKLDQYLQETATQVPRLAEKTS